MSEDLMQSTKVIASALIIYENEILLLRRARDFMNSQYGKGLWELPGGKVERGEKIDEALKREVSEETAIDPPADISLTGALNYIVKSENHSVHRFHIIYQFLINSIPNFTLSDEHDKYLWLNDPFVIHELPMVEEIKNFLNRFLTGDNLNL